MFYFVVIIKQNPYNIKLKGVVILSSLGLHTGEERSATKEQSLSLQTCELPNWSTYSKWLDIPCAFVNTHEIWKAEKTGHLHLFIFSQDESPSKEEPSSTVEEIETKSFNEQSSEGSQREADDGKLQRARREWHLHEAAEGKLHLKTEQLKIYFLCIQATTRQSELCHHKET